MWLHMKGSGRWIFGSLIVSIGLMMGADKLLLGPGDRDWPVFAALALSGVFCLAAGLRARLRPPRMIVERDTGRELVRRPHYAAFLLWGALFVAGAIWGVA